MPQGTTIPRKYPNTIKQKQSTGNITSIQNVPVNLPLPKTSKNRGGRFMQGVDLIKNTNLFSLHFFFSFCS